MKTALLPTTRFMMKPASAFSSRSLLFTFAVNRSSFGIWNLTSASPFTVQNIAPFCSGTRLYFAALSPGPQLVWTHGGNGSGRGGVVSQTSSYSHTPPYTPSFVCKAQWQLSYDKQLTSYDFLSFKNKFYIRSNELNQRMLSLSLLMHYQCY